MQWQNRIVVDPAILAGKPIIKGTRLSVEFIVGLLAQSWREEEILQNYPGLLQKDILACLRYATAILQTEKVCPFSVTGVVYAPVG